MYLSTFQELYKLYLSIDVLKYKVLLPGSGYRQPGYRFGVNILGPTLLQNQGASHYFNEVLCANSNFTDEFEQKVDATVLGRLYSPICVSSQIVTLYSNYFHLYHSPLLTSTHKVKPVLARAPSSIT